MGEVYWEILYVIFPEAVLLFGFSHIFVGAALNPKARRKFIECSGHVFCRGGELINDV